MGYGIGGFLAVSRQQSFGTATSSWEYVGIISESLTTNIEQLIEENLYGRFDEPDQREGLLTVAGDVVFEPHPITLGHFLRAVSGQASATAVDSSFTWQFVPKQTDFDDLCALPPYTLQVYRSVGSAYQFTDAIVHTLAVEITAGAIVRATASIMARVSSLMNYTTASYPTGDPWMWNQASVSMAAAANSDMESVTVTIDNPVEGVPLLDGTKIHGRYKRTGFRTVRIAGTQDFSTQTQYNIFRSQSRQAIDITLRGAATATSYYNTLTLEMPQVVYSTFGAEIGGPGRISASYEGKAEYDTGSSYTIRPTLVNTRAAY